MSKIKVLNESLINKIAAGEVIERPVSVIKELIENSIDAGANKILVELKEGGISFIKVTDDGSGMSKEDVMVSILRHATSKISEADDLFKIKSLGFRGEALSSIAAISRIKIKTNCTNQDGIKVNVENGKIIKTQSFVMPKGTSIQVEDLFFNVPARKKHLKTIETEFRLIVDIITRYTLIHPEVYFELIHNGKIIINSPGTNDIIGNISNIYNTQIAKNLILCEHGSGGIKVSGCISKPGFQLKNKNFQSLFINQRYIKNRCLVNAIYESYHTFLNVNKHPVFIINIDINPEKIDVNVHPQKSIIRIEKEELVCDVLKDAIKDAFNKIDLIQNPDLTLKNINHIDEAHQKTDSQAWFSHKNKYIIKKENQLLFDDFNVKNAPEISTTATATTATTAATTTTATNKDVNNIIDKNQLNNQNDKTQKPILKTQSNENRVFSQFKVLGQVKQTFIIVSVPDGMVLIDQHALQERINYEKFMDNYKNNNIESQNLLEPLIIEVTPEESILIISNIDFLKKLGFTIEEFGKNSFILRDIPIILGRLQSRDVFLSILDELKVGKTTKLDAVKEEKIIKKACKVSIKANQLLELPQMYKLIDDLGSVKQPYTCPHGRPTMVKLTSDDLEKMFRRKGL